MKIHVVALVLLFAICNNATAQNCTPVYHASDDLVALNRIWGTNIPICQIAPGSNNAFADRAHGIVWADQAWLDGMAGNFGPWAATGVLAHEWGHMVQGNVSGTAAELQADCLAGVFMRAAGLPEYTATQFATANLFAGDAEWSFGGHGLGPQRLTAVMRGYRGYAGQHPSALPLVCPLSAF